MSTGLIIAIVVVAIILIALFAFVLPKARHKQQVRSRERELEQRRDRVAGQHREEATERSRQAEMAEQKARMAEQEARRERADAELHEERARTHERGMADHELVDESERDKFAETSAMRQGPNDPAPMSDSDDPNRGAVSSERDMSDYEQGHVDERQGRFDRDKADEPTRPAS